jgi:hypothetical protein
MIGSAILKTTITGSVGIYFFMPWYGFAMLKFLNHLGSEKASLKKNALDECKGEVK